MSADIERFAVCERCAVAVENDDYTGFDITESKHRSILWQLLVPPVDTKRIGRKSYWEALVLPRLSGNKG